MKEIMFGMAVGIVVGALLYKNNETAKQIVNKGQQMLEKEMNSMQKQSGTKKK